jgi:hypothetical protein
MFLGVLSRAKPGVAYQANKGVHRVLPKRALVMIKGVHRALTGKALVMLEAPKAFPSASHMSS